MNNLVSSVDNIVQTAELVANEVGAEAETRFAIEHRCCRLDCGAHRVKVHLVGVEHKCLCGLPTEYDHLILTELYGSYGTGPNKVLIRNFNDDPVLLGDRQSIVAAIYVSSEVRLLPAVEDADHQERRCLALRLLPRHQVHSLIVHCDGGRVRDCKG